MVITDRDGGEKRMFVGAGHAGETWSCVVGGQDDVMVDAEGWGTFRTLGGRTSVYLRGGAVLLGAEPEIAPRVDPAVFAD